MRFLRLISLITYFLISACSDQEVWDRVNDPDVLGDEPVYNISVVSVEPADGSLNVGINETFEVVFDDNIDMSTVNSGSFIINGGTVGGSYSYSSFDKRVIFTPDFNLSFDSVYSVVLTEDIKSLVGDSLISQYSWSFNTEGVSTSEISVLEDLTSVSLTSGGTFDTGTSAPSLCSSYTLVIRNDGLENLSVNGMSLAGVNSSDFSIVPPALPLSLSTGGTAQFTVDFCPGTTGSKNAFIEIDNNDVDENPFVINLYGVSLASAEPEIDLYEGTLRMPSGEKYNFGNLPIGTSSSPVPFRIVNRGSADLIISGVSVNDSTGSFVVDTGSMNFTLAPQESTVFTVTFTAQLDIKLTVQMSIGCNDSDENPYSIIFMGKGK